MLYNQLSHCRHAVIFVDGNGDKHKNILIMSVQCIQGIHSNLQNTSVELYLHLLLWCFHWFCHFNVPGGLAPLSRLCSWNSPSVLVHYIIDILTVPRVSGITRVDCKSRISFDQLSFRSFVYHRISLLLAMESLCSQNRKVALPAVGQ